MSFNLRGTWAIYRFELARTWRTLFQSILTPVLTTSLYFIVFGGAIGQRIDTMGGVPYAAFIVPGLLMLTIRPKAPPTPASASTCRASPARSTNCCRRRSASPRRCWAMWARR